MKKLKIGQEKYLKKFSKILKLMNSHRIITHLKLKKLRIEQISKFFKLGGENFIINHIGEIVINEFF